jgi:hypothetical protein
MMRAIRTQSVVRPGGVVEVQSPELVPGATVDIIVLVDSQSRASRSLVDLIGAAKGVFASPQEVDEYIRRERDAWES